MNFRYIIICVLMAAAFFLVIKWIVYYIKQTQKEMREGNVWLAGFRVILSRQHLMYALTVGGLILLGYFLSR